MPSSAPPPTPNGTTQPRRSRHRRPRPAASGRTVALLLALLASPTARASAAADAGQPHLLLVTIDTLRADFVSANGATRVRTPHLDSLAAAGVNFNRARSPVPLTLPSHASILTGKLPPAHGVRDNGTHRLPEAETTLAEALRAAGYQTAAFVGSFVLHRRFGLAQGFDVYDDRTWSDVAMLERLDAERPGDLVADAFESWLEGADRSAPLFAWVHLFDPHAPYAPPSPFAEEYADDPYAGEVAYADHVVGRLVGALERRGLLPRTVIAVAGDHGEGLGEHDETTHSLLIYNSTLHVPMILVAPGRIPAGAVVDRLVSLVDLAPTILELLGHAESFGEGASLRPLIAATRAAAEREIPSERLAYSESLYPSLHLGWSALHGLETDRYRFILAPRPELYDIVADPGETRNLAASAARTAEDLKRRLQILLRSFPTLEETPAPSLDAQDEARLLGLGYLGGSRRAWQGPAVDPKSKMVLWNEMQRALAQFSAARYAAAAEALEELIENEPDTALLYEYLATAYRHLGDHERAAATLERALRRDVESAAIHLELGQLARRRGDAATAASSFRAALRLDPSSVAALHHLADLSRAHGRQNVAIDLYRRALALNPDYVYSWSGLAMALAASARDTEAEDAFREAMRLAPDEPLPRFNLAVHLDRSGQAAAAVSEYRAFLALTTGRSDSSEQRRAAEKAVERLLSAAG